MESDTYHVRLADGRQFGPAAPDLLAQWARQGRIPRDAMIVGRNGETTPALRHPATAPTLAAPPTVPPVVISEPDAALSGLIPYRNPQALVGYYTSIGSLIPGLGVLLGPAAIVLGILGFRNYRRDRRCKGPVHAWIAIVLGLIGSLISYGCVVPTIIAAVAE